MDEEEDFPSADDVVNFGLKCWEERIYTEVVQFVKSIVIIFKSRLLTVKIYLQCSVPRG